MLARAPLSRQGKRGGTANRITRPLVHHLAQISRRGRGGREVPRLSSPRSARASAPHRLTRRPRSSCRTGSGGHSGALGGEEAEQGEGGDGEDEAAENGLGQHGGSSFDTRRCDGIRRSVSEREAAPPCGGAQSEDRRGGKLAGAPRRARGLPKIDAPSLRALRPARRSAGDCLR